MKQLDFVYNRLKENRNEFDLVKNIQENQSINPVEKLLLQNDSRLFAGEIARQIHGENKFYLGIIDGYLSGKGFENAQIEDLFFGLHERMKKIETGRCVIFNENQRFENYSQEIFEKDLGEVRKYYNQLFANSFDYIDKWEMYNELFGQESP